MKTFSTPWKKEGPAYIYNVSTNLRELKDVNLCGANLFFNGPFCVADLSEIDLSGATVILNGQQVSVRAYPLSDVTKNR